MVFIKVVNMLNMPNINILLPFSDFAMLNEYQSINISENEMLSYGAWI